MSHEIYSITNVENVAPYTVRLTFDDGVVKTINLEPMLRGELYGPLHDLEFFNQVRLDKEAGTIVWPNEADFDPATLHDWDEVGQDMMRMAETWQSDTDSPSEVFEQVLESAQKLVRREKINLIRALVRDVNQNDLPMTMPLATLGDLSDALNILREAQAAYDAQNSENKPE